jgi:hypothetical protein
VQRCRCHGRLCARRRTVDGRHDDDVSGRVRQRSVGWRACGAQVSDGRCCDAVGDGRAAERAGHTIPLSARRAQALDLATVERRGHGAPNNPPPKPNRMFGLQESLTYRPTAEQFKDPVQYIASIREEAQKYGIVKIIPPDTWNPDFAIDTEVRDHACDFYSPFAMHILSFSSLADTLTALPLSHTQARAELG